MAIDKAVDSSQLNAALKAVADAIRTKGGTSGLLEFPGGFADAIAAIQAGGDGNGLAYDMGEFSVSEDVNTNNLGGGGGLDPMKNGIPHNLGEVPDFICVWTDAWAGITEAPYTSGASMVGFVWLRGMSGTIGRAAASVNITNPLVVQFSIMQNDYRCGGGLPTSAAYGMEDKRLPTAEVFRTITMGTGTWWRAGATYNYFVSRAWWNVGGGASA